MPSVKITKFGGIFPVIAPQNLNTMLATVAENCNLVHGTLQPFRQPTKESGITGNSIFVDSCCFIASENCEARFVKTGVECKRIHATGTHGYPVTNSATDACAGEWQRLGFPCDITPISASIDYVVQEGFKYESRFYYYTLFNEFGEESMPSPVSNNILVEEGKRVFLSNIQSSFPTYNVAGIYIYVSSTGLDFGNNKFEDLDASFLRIGEIQVGQTTFIHEPETIHGEECQTMDFAPPPDNLRDIAFWHTNQLSGLSGDSLVFSECANYHGWPEYYKLDFHDKPQRWMVARTMGYLLTDGFPVVVSVTQNCTGGKCRDVKVCQEQIPLLGKQSPAIYNDAVVYSSKDGLVMMQGDNVKVISTEFYSREDWQALKPWTFKGVVHDGYYYGFGEVVNIRFKLPESIYEKTDIESLTTIRFDLSDDVELESLASIPVRAAYRSAQDKLFVSLGDGIYQWDNSDKYMTLTWRTRLNVLGGYTSMSHYKTVITWAKARVKHFVNKYHVGEIVAEKKMLKDKIILDSRPKGLPVGWSSIEWEAEIKTKGEVREYHLSTSIQELSE
jgi:hypothetical protein